MNNAMLEVAIADFFHCKHISDKAIESPRFALMMKYACLASNDFDIVGAI
jgi:hypothetical protein